MTLNLLYQLFCIGLVAGAGLYFWDQVCGMKYSFYYIILRAIFYRDFKPMDWLINHIYYICFLLLVVGHLINLIGLLQQISDNEIIHKSAAFFISPFFNQIGMVGSIFFILRKERHFIKRIFSKENIL